MVACWRLGAVAQPCTEQLRPASDLRARMDLVDPRAVVLDERDLPTLDATGFGGEVLIVPDQGLLERSPPSPAGSSPRKTRR